MDAAVLTSMRHEGPCDDDGITAGLLSASRAERWRRMADEANHGPIKEGYYAALLSRTSAGGESSVAQQVAKQVDKDLHRTFGSLRGLRVPTTEALQSLRNVLLAYAEHNPQVGYCQSMNFLVAVLRYLVSRPHHGIP